MLVWGRVCACMLHEGLGLVVFLCMPNSSDDDVLVHVKSMGSHLEDILYVMYRVARLKHVCFANFNLVKINFVTTHYSRNICLLHCLSNDMVIRIDKKNDISNSNRHLNKGPIHDTPQIK